MFYPRVDLFNTRKRSRLAFLSDLGCVRAIDRGAPYRNRDSQPNQCGQPKMAKNDQKTVGFSQIEHSLPLVNLVP